MFEMGDSFSCIFNNALAIILSRRQKLSTAKDFEVKLKEISFTAKVDVFDLRHYSSSVVFQRT